MWGNRTARKRAGYLHNGSLHSEPLFLVQTKLNISPDMSVRTTFGLSERAPADFVVS
jgi:hypothetical protein